MRTRSSPSWRLGSLAAPLIPVGAAVVACATIGSPAGGSSDLPSANVGPFRTITKTEDLGGAPVVLDSPTAMYREPSVLAVHASDPTSTDVYLYAVSSMPAGTSTHDVVVRTRADDGRSFYGTILDVSNGTTQPAVVLTADQPWEGQDLSGPSALQVGPEIYLYYAAEGGIGLARSSDGLTFMKEASPVLAPDSSVAWEKTPPRAPSVTRLPDGSFDMMYGAGLSIGEATSQDGVHFTRVDADPTTPGVDPVLSPLGGRPATPASAEAGSDAAAEGGTPTGPFDTGQVADPCVLAVTDPTGLLVMRVLYTGYTGGPADPNRSSAILLAARYGTKGKLSRQTLPALSINKHEAAPAYFRWSGGEFLYFGMETGGGLLSMAYPAIGAAVAPAPITLPPPTGYASSP